jgi:hypothetical protein
MAQATYDVIEYAFYNDGTESGSTIIGSSNNQQTLTVNTIYLLRLQIHNDNNKASSGNQWQFEFNHAGGGWTDITTSAAAIQAVDSSNLTEGEDCTNRLTNQGANFISDNNGVTEDGLTTAYEHAASDYIEVLLAFQIPYAQVSDTDEILVRGYESANGRTTTFTVTADIDVNKPVQINASAGSLTATGQQGSIELSLSKINANAGAMTLTGQAGKVIGPVWLVDLEEQDLTDFDSTTNPSNMAANSAASMIGAYGCEFTYSSGSPPIGHITTAAYFTKIENSGELRTRFYFDINNLSMGSADEFWLMWWSCDGTVGGSNRLFALEVKEVSGNYQINLSCKDDGGTTYDTTQTTISDAKHYIDIYSKRATGSTDNNGIVRMWIDDVETGGSLTNLDNWDLWMTQDGCDIGLTWGEDATTSGSFYIDECLVVNGGPRLGSADISISASAGAATLTGQQASISVAAGVTINAAAGAATLSGQAGSIVSDIHIDASAGAMTLSGQSATIKSNIRRIASAGSLTLTGQSGSIKSSIRRIANAGSATLTGQSASIKSSIRRVASAGAMSLTGQSATIETDVILQASSGTLTLTGQQATIFAIVGVSANVGSMSLTGLQATIKSNIRRTAQAGSATLTGLQATIKSNVRIVANSGTLTLSGQGATVEAPVSISAAIGSMSLSGQAASIRIDIQITAAVGSLTLSGLQATITAGTSIGAGAGALTLTGLTASIQAPISLDASAGSMSLTGQAAQIVPGPVAINANVGSLTLAGLTVIIFTLLYPDPDSVYYAEHRERRVYMRYREKRIYIDKDDKWEDV